MQANELTFTLLQSSLHWEDKAANLQMFEQKIESISQKTEVVILPEMFSTGFTMNAAVLSETMEGPTVQWMKDISAKHKIILVGSLIIKENLWPAAGSNGNEAFFNRLIWMLPNGQYGFYDKRHLFGFAGEDQSYSPGNKRFIASVNGWKINLQVCYDLRFPVWSRQTRSNSNGDYTAEYDVLIYVANWPLRRNHAWKTLLQARAIENQSYVIGVNRIGEDGNGIAHNGDSMVVGPLGEVLYHKEKEEDIFTITLDKTKQLDVRNKFPFLKDGDGFAIY